MTPEVHVGVLLLTGHFLRQHIMTMPSSRISCSLSFLAMQRIRLYSVTLRVPFMRTYEVLKSELAKKFDYTQGPFTEGEDAGVLSLNFVPEQTYYDAVDLTFEEFRKNNTGPGYPFKLPSVINYEQWEEEGKPDDGRFIFHHSPDDQIEKLMELMSRQFEGTLRLPAGLVSG